MKRPILNALGARAPPHPHAAPLPALLSTPSLRGILIGVLLLNILDAYYSVLFIHNARVLVEANPIMDLLLSFGLGGVPFVMAKTALVTTGCMVMWQRPRLAIAQAGAYCCLIAYFTTVMHFYLFSLVGTL